MKAFANNFLNFPGSSQTVDYSVVAERMTVLQLKSVSDSKHHFHKKSMLSFLKDYRNHVFFNEFSLAIIQVTSFEADLLTFLVEPNQRKNGVGKKLLELVILYLKDLKVEKLFLEVAINNEVAIKIYSQMGFKSCGTRKNYYLSEIGTQSDASVMVFHLSRKNGKLDKKKLQKLYPTG